MIHDTPGHRPVPRAWGGSRQVLARLLLLCFFGGLMLLSLSGCRSAPRLPPVNIAEPGWSLREGQSLWRSQRDGPEIAGEIIVASRADGRSLVQLVKAPLPLLTAQTTPGAWQIEFISEQRLVSGQGAPPTKWIWLHLARALNGSAIPPAPLKFRKLDDGGSHLENAATGESLTVYLNE